MLKKNNRQHYQKTGEEKYSIGIVAGKMVFPDYEIQQQHTQHTNYYKDGVCKQ